MNAQQPARERRADQRCCRNRDVEAGNRPGAITRAKPVRQVNNHSWEEAGFCKSQEETGSIELRGVLHKASEDRDYSPGDHYPCNPLPRAPAFDNDCPWYLEQNEGQVEYAYAETVHAIAKAQVGTHSEIREGNIHAI